MLKFNIDICLFKHQSLSYGIGNCVKGKVRFLFYLQCFSCFTIQFFEFILSKLINTNKYLHNSKNSDSNLLVTNINED